jgi:site-specific recombinase XerD
MIETASTAELSKELIGRYREDCEMRGLSSESLRSYIATIKIFEEYLEMKGLDFFRVDKNVLRGFLEYLRKDRQVGHKTTENYITSIAGFYDYLEYEDMIEKNPVHSIRKRYIKSYEKMTRVK